MSSSYNLPPGCGKLPGEEPEEPAYWSLGEAVAKQVQEDHGDWKERGNRSDYIASDCWKDADLDGISTGILSVQGTDHGITVVWGWSATFCSGDERADEMAMGIIMECGIPGSWDVDRDACGASWHVSGENQFSINLDDIEEPWLAKQKDIRRVAKKVWSTFCKHRKAIVRSAEKCHELLEENYKDVCGDE